MKLGFSLGMVFTLIISLNHGNGFLWTFLYSISGWFYVAYSPFAD